MQIGLVVNPASGGGRGASLGAELSGLLRDRGHEVVDLSASTMPAAQARATAALPQLDLLAVAGGDGMVHLGANVCAQRGVPLAIVASGTGNDVARSLGLPLHDPAAAVELISARPLRHIDLAQVSLLGSDEGTPRRWFAGVLAAGFDALVNERANSMRWPRGPARYSVALARELPLFRPLDYRLCLDGTWQETEAMLVTVANAPSYGGGMQVCPDAVMDDGLLDVLVLGRVSKATLVRIYPTVFTGTHVQHPAVKIIRAREVRIEGPRVIGYADGERLAPLPLQVAAVPGALAVVAPS